MKVESIIPPAMPMQCEWKDPGDRKPQREFSRYIYAYSRVSTVDQVESGLGLEAYAQQIKSYLEYVQLPINNRMNQRLAKRLVSLRWPEQAAKEFCRYSNYTFAGHYVEHAVSANKMPFADRPVGKVICDRIRPGDMVVFPKFDRAFRDTQDALRMQKEWQGGVIAFHFLDLQIDTADESLFNLVFTLMAAVSQHQSDYKRDRTREALTEKRARGEWLGGSVGTGMFLRRWKDSEGVNRSKLFINRHEAPILRWCRWMLATKGKSHKQTSDRLEAILAKREGREVLPESLTMAQEHKGMKKRPWPERKCRMARGQWERLIAEGKAGENGDWWKHAAVPPTGKRGRPKKISA